MRSLILAALSALSLSAATATATPSEIGRLSFDVTRNGQPFGRHSIVVTGAGESLRAQSNVALRANVGPLTVFRLEQTCTENWRGGVLAGIDCSTLKDGRRVRVRGAQADGRLRISGAEGETWFPLSAFPTSWWTKPPSGQVTMIDTQTGEAMPVRVSSLGRSTAVIDGREIPVERVRVAGTLTMDLLYDLEDRWVGGSFTARGQRVEYRLTTPLDAAPA